MALDDNQRARLDEWLNEKVLPNCPYCGSSKRTYGEIIPNEIPMVQVICKNCRCVRLFDASAIELV